MNNVSINAVFKATQKKNTPSTSASRHSTSGSVPVYSDVRSTWPLHRVHHRVHSSIGSRSTDIQTQYATDHITLVLSLT